MTFRPNIRLYINKDIFTIWVITFSVSLFAFILGVYRGNAGAIPYVGLYLAWPALFLYFMLRCNSINTVIILLRTIVYGGLIVSLFNLLMIINSFMLHISILERFGDILKCSFNINEGFAEYFSPSGNHLPYIIYFCLSLLFLDSKVINIKKRYLVICIIIGIIDILASNRRAMWLVIMILPFVIMFFLSLLPYHKRIIVKILGLGIVAATFVTFIILTFLNIEYIQNEFFTSFESDNSSNIERVLQAKSLFADFLERPLLGSGLGHVSSYIRTPHAPWSYELTFNYNLTELGIIGFSIYGFAILWTYIKSIVLSNKSIIYASMLIPQIMGLLSLMMISITNPYIATFDFVWTIFLPIITINTLWKEKQNEKQKKESFCIPKG